ncbi:MAG: ribbon-helix-helix domain-containing protein [Candidatus Amesbacteria bacterium]|nr:ribbon-helix-helix domain-containing protein [Candidatus Amesbacteria bacterium]
MNSITLNISLPYAMHADAKKMVRAQKYTSVSELIRDAMRKIMYRDITVNGFTKQFEEETLRAAAEPIENSIEWNGKGSFTDFVLSHRTSNAKNNIRSRLYKEFRTSKNQKS